MSIRNRWNAKEKNKANSNSPEQSTYNVSWNEWAENKVKTLHDMRTARRNEKHKINRIEFPLVDVKCELCMSCVSYVKYILMRVCFSSQCGKCHANEIKCWIGVYLRNLFSKHGLSFLPLTIKKKENEKSERKSKELKRK